MELPFEQESDHERRLREFFSECDIDERTPPFGHPVCIMLFTNRSGSSVVGEYMRATRQFAGFGEPLNQQAVVDVARREGFTRYRQYLQYECSRVLEKTSGKGMVGMKASYGQAMMLYRSGIIPHFFRDVRWGMFQRRDMLAQAISLSIALQTGRWRKRRTDTGEPATYDFADIRLRLARLSAARGALENFCAVLGLAPFRILYEDFIADPEQGARELAAHLGADEVSFDESMLRMRKQGSGQNAEFRARFLADYRETLRQGGR